MKQLQRKIQQSYDIISSHFSQTRKKVWNDIHFFKPYFKKHMLFLDMGCGNGRILDYIKEYEPFYTGIDFSKGLIKEAKKNHPECEFHTMDMSEFFIDKQFDIISSMAAFHHLPSHRLQKKTLTQWKKMLKSNGYICITVWNLYQNKYIQTYILSFLREIFSGNFGRNIMIPWKNSQGKLLAKRYYYDFRKKDLYTLASEADLKIEFCEYVRNGKIVENKWNAHNLICIMKQNEYKKVKVLSPEKTKPIFSFTPPQVASSKERS